ncbi:hypothetical protein [Domibacillus robiginosus]|uniref:hypothetical protein n=1 Tax=Domibacillus robiginosus TaxID=1071054 RepID=UPI00067DDABD|nr:hypothetical protein [Domibacillus robiginosus]
MKKPLGVSIISYFYIFGAFILLFSLFFYDVDANQIDIATRFGLPNAPEQLMRVLVAFSSLVITYGYIKLRKWGFWAMVGYCVLFIVISFSLSLSSYNHQPFIGNTIWSLIVLLYTIYINKAFFQNKPSV